MQTFFSHWFGLDNASGPIYLWWSGFFGDVTIFAALIAFYLHHSCHVGRCYRLGRHKVDGTPYTTCRKHHPAINGRITHQDVALAHTEGQIP